VAKALANRAVRLEILTGHQAGLGPQIGKVQSIQAKFDVKIPGALLVGKVKLVIGAFDAQAAGNQVIPIGRGYQRARLVGGADVIGRKR